MCSALGDGRGVTVDLDSRSLPEDSVRGDQIHGSEEARPSAPGRSSSETGSTEAHSRRQKEALLISQRQTGGC